MNTEKKGMSKTVKFSLYGVAGILVLGILINLLASKETKQQWAKDAAEKEAAKHTPAALIEASLPMGCTFIYDSTKHSASVFYTEANMWDGYSLVRHHFGKAVDFGEKAFVADSTLKSFVMCTKTELMDGNGNKDTAIVLMHTFLRDPFMLIKWQNFKMQPITTQLNRVTVDSESYMHATIRKNISVDELPTKLYLE